MQNQSDQIVWRDGNVPVSTLFDDPFFSLENGVAETEHVFMVGNDLPARFRPGFQIAELGFGTGLNLLVAWDTWMRRGEKGALRFTSFEAYPMPVADMRRAHRLFPDFNGRRDMLAEAWTGVGGRLSLPGLELDVIVGKAADKLPLWDEMADAWFLDGFSPAKNPDLWGETLMQYVFDHTQPFGSAATYTAAGFVRRNLENSGFNVERTQGYGRKRHMTRAKKVT